MANLLHTKGSRTQVLNSFPTRSFGKDGDIVISKINGKGTYLCSKAGGSWYAANKLQQLSRLEKTSIRDLSVSKLSINNMINSFDSADKFVINNNGKLEYRTTSEVSNDLNILDINYKTAHCSLGQYTDKESCEAGGGTWYYSENDSHDNLSSTAENQLLTVGESIGNLDAEPTLLYDGSTLEIKYNSDYDDNWQTSAQTDLLKLSYDSSKNAIFNVDSNGNLTIDCTNNISLDADNGNIYIKDGGINHFYFDCDDTEFTIYDDSNEADYLRFTVAANGASTITTNDGDGTAGHLTLDADGDIELNADGGDITFKDGGTTSGKIEMGVSSSLYLYSPLDSGDYFRIATIAHGATTISTLDDAATAGHLTLDIDGSLILDPADGKFIAKKAGTEFSATDSAYAGMILGYTCLRNLGNSGGEETITIGTSMTVLETSHSNKVSVTFTAPPSGNVEIEFCALCDASSKTIKFALSDNATFNELAAIHTYDNKCITIDETDDVIANARWFLTGLTAGSSYQYWIGAKASSASAYISHGVNRFNAHAPPITVKAIALPATCVTGE